MKPGTKAPKMQPWDADPDTSIDPWKMEQFDPSWNEGGMLEVSSFGKSFQNDREELREHLEEAWPTVKRALKKLGLSCKLNLEEGSMMVSTTRNTRDPYIVVKARDLIRLLAKSVPAPQKRFALRRDRILGPNMSTLQAIEDFTGCYILAKGSTVSAMGSFTGLKQVRKIVKACMKNIKDPISHIQFQLIRNSKLNVSWEERCERRNFDQPEGASNDESGPQKKHKSSKPK